MTNTGMKAFPPPVNVSPVSGTLSSLSPLVPCSVGQPTVQSAKGENNLSHKTGYLYSQHFLP